MKYNLVQRISFSFVILIVVCVILISTLSNIFVEDIFKNYVIHKQNEINNELLSSVKQSYNPNNEWDVELIESLGITALDQGMIIKVKDNNGNTIWDARVHNDGLCTDMLQEIRKNMIQKYPNLNGGYTEKKFSLENNNIQFGTLEIGYYGPFYLLDHDLTFINGINKIFYGVGALSLIISLIISSVLSKRIGNPIAKVIDKAEHISEGYFDGRIDDKSDIKEISQLISSVNDLANSLEKQDTLRKRLTSDVAHELRTPLSSLRGNLEAMIDGVWNPSKERLESCHEEILRITRLVSDLEKLTQYESDNLILNKTSFSLSDVITNSIISLEHKCKEKEITVKFNDKCKNIFADKDKITQVIINILTNAIKYNKIGGHIEITTSLKDGKVVISLKDNGIGISKEDLPYIFERFYRADKSRDRSTGGSGIGLAITKAIIEAHGGNIVANSEFGEGTEVVITLPNNK